MAFGELIDQKIRGMAGRGISVREIARALGPNAPSKSSIDRFLRSEEGKATPAPASSQPAKAPRKARASALKAPESVPLDEAPPETLAWWLAEVRASFDVAKADGNIAAQASLAARATALLEAQRKAAPPPTVDPNERPDLVAAAERCKARLRDKLVRHLAGAT